MADRDLSGSFRGETGGTPTSALIGGKNNSIRLEPATTTSQIGAEVARQVRIAMSLTTLQPPISRSLVPQFLLLGEVPDFFISSAVLGLPGSLSLVTSRGP